MPQFEPIGVNRQRNSTGILGLIIIIIFIFFAFNILRLWTIYLPRMEEAGRETSAMISGQEGGGAAISIINTDIIPEIRFFLVLTIIAFGLLDGIFSFMLWKGNHGHQHEMLIMPFFSLYLISRIASVFLLNILTSSALIGSNPRSAMNALYITTLICSTLGIVIILLFHKKIFTTSKRTATKILVRRSEESTP